MSRTCHGRNAKLPMTTLILLWVWMIRKRRIAMEKVKTPQNNPRPAEPVIQQPNERKIPIKEIDPPFPSTHPDSPSVLE